MNLYLRAGLSLKPQMVTGWKKDRYHPNYDSLCLPIMHCGIAGLWIQRIPQH